MSYDLYFLKKKTSPLTEEGIRNYLGKNVLNNTNGNKDQWYWENEDTEVYFLIDYFPPEVGEGENQDAFDEGLNNFEGYDNTGFTFNLNFVRPQFFGMEAFDFVEKFIDDLDLYIVNPQSSVDADNPYKPVEGELYGNWNKTNLSSSANFFERCNLVYCDPNISDAVWRYNGEKTRLQEGLGDGYYVPKVFFFRTLEMNEIIRVTSWTESIPNVFPPFDYILLCRSSRKLWRTVEENGLISRETFECHFANYLEDFDFPECRIIHPEQAERTLPLFNKVNFEQQIEGFCERMAMELLSNARPK